METTIYYFTGTGNGLKIAKDIKEELPKAKLIRICNSNMKIREDISSDIIGFIFPVYYRGLPHMVRDFIENLIVNDSAYIFGVASYGSYEAISFHQIDEMLKNKGTKLSAGFRIDMPGNMWFMYYPHPKSDFIERIENQKDKTIKIVEKIKNKEINKLKTLENYEEELKIYENFNPKEMDKDFWSKEICNGCGTCIKVCPASNIELKDKRPKWRHECEFCLACIHWCPKEAIEFKKDSINKERYHNTYIKIKEVMR